MGWSSGQRLMADVIEIVKREVPDLACRERVYGGLITAFDEHDCDTLDECCGVDPAYDLAYERLYPPEEGDGQ